VGKLSSYDHPSSHHGTRKPWELSFIGTDRSEEDAAMKERVREILSWYGSDNPGTLTNLARLLNHGKLGGTGKLVILPVDQGFEHGPARSFAPNPPAYDPRYHFELAIEAGCNAYAAPLGFLEAGAREFAGEIPLILKVNDHDILQDEKDPNQALTGSVGDALRLGCVGIGFTIYPGSSHRFEMYQQIRAYAEVAKQNGLVVVIWSYPRGSGLSKPGESAIDVCGYAAHLGAQLGAHLVKVKIPTAHIEQDAARKVYEKAGIPIGTLAERIRHVMQCCFNGRRIVIFSGGPAESDDSLLEEIRGVHAGGGFGSIIGRNSFQREKDDALALLDRIMAIYAGTAA
jgi:fructose-bisphosphate aldolase, class I